MNQNSAPHKNDTVSGVLIQARPRVPGNFFFKGMVITPFVFAFSDVKLSFFTFLTNHLPVFPVP